MLARQLCVFDDKTDSKSKRVKKTHSMVVWFELSSFFVKISICVALLSRDLFNDRSECVCHALTQEIRTIKTFIRYKSATAGKFITKKTQVSSVTLRSL